MTPEALENFMFTRGRSNRIAFLDMIAVAEGTVTSPATRAHGYDVIVTGMDGPEIFTDFSAHPFAPEYPGNHHMRRPSKVINKSGLTSNAAGRYQFMLVHWPHYRDQLNLPDFGPESQDKWALQLIRERSALPLIDAGDLSLAIARCKNLWASLPGAGYGQPEHSFDRLKTAYMNAGGMLT